MDPKEFFEEALEAIVGWCPGVGPKQIIDFLMSQFCKKEADFNLRRAIWGTKLPWAGIL